MIGHATKETEIITIYLYIYKDISIYYSTQRYLPPYFR